MNAADLMPAPPPGLIKIEIGNQLDGSLDNFARRFWEHLGTEANGLINDALTGKDPITELVYSDRYVCSPLVVNLLVSVIHELGRLSDADFAIRILGRQYQREDNRSPWQYRHDWHSARERDEALRQALAYCGREGEVLSLPTLPHYRRLQLKLRSGNQLTIQFDQGLSYWEAERSESLTSSGSTLHHASLEKKSWSASGVKFRRLGRKTLRYSSLPLESGSTGMSIGGNCPNFRTPIRTVAK